MSSKQLEPEKAPQREDGTVTGAVDQEGRGNRAQCVGECVSRSACPGLNQLGYLREMWWFFLVGGMEPSGHPELLSRACLGCVSLCIALTLWVAGRSPYK